MDKQYAERDIDALDDAGKHYIRHVSAMSIESLHSKMAIAAELGHRDMRIDQLKAQVERLRGYLQGIVDDGTGSIMGAVDLLKETPSQSLAEHDVALLDNQLYQINTAAYPKYEDEYGRGHYDGMIHAGQMLRLKVDKIRSDET
jgi:hypothetical protein